METGAVIERLLRSENPSIRWKARVGALGEDPGSPEIAALREEIRNGDVARTLLSCRDAHGRIEPARSVYAKWQGAHWTLAALADIGYPPGDESLVPARDQVLDVWLSPGFYEEFEAATKAAAYGKRGIAVMEGRYRAHPSQHGNALYAVMTLGLDDGRAEKLVERMLYWQWPDGGWNCDKNPAARMSSFMETVTPLRGLAAYAKLHDDAAVREAIRRAAEVLLERRLFRRRSDGAVIHPEFTKLHYPLYWHYDFLHGLKALAEAGMIGNDHVDWGGTSKRVMNEWVTADALTVLRAAGRA